MEKIATATYSFEKVRRAGYVYVDKTDMARTAMARTAAVSAAGAGQGDGHVTTLPSRRRQYGARLALARGAGTLPCRPPRRRRYGGDGASRRETAERSETAEGRGGTE